MTGGLEALFAPRSVAVVGASRRPEAAGLVVLRNLRASGFPGPVYPVNPRYPEIDGLPCYGSLAELPERVDAVFYAVPAAGGPELLEQAAALGIRAAVVHASGYADSGPAGAALESRLRAIADRYPIQVCGPNTLGVLNVRRHVPIWALPLTTETRPGPVAIISQSGSAAMVMARDLEDIGLAYVIGSGNEAALDTADYLDYVVGDEGVSMVAMFIETIRSPQKFAAAALRASRLGKHVIAITVGSSQTGRVAVRAHTGAITDDGRMRQVFLERHGLILVSDFDEMLETARLFSRYPLPPQRQGIAAITLSGGEAALIADLAHAAGLRLPACIDAWGLGWNRDRFASLVDVLLQEEPVGSIVPVLDLPAQGQGDGEMGRDIAGILGSRAGATSKRFVIVNNTSASGTDREVVQMAASAGIPCLSGLRPGLTALAHWTRYRLPQAVSEPVPPTQSTRWRQQLARSLGEVDRIRLLRDAGIPMAASLLASSEALAVEQAEVIGYPVALKGWLPGLLHKRAAGLVRLGLCDRNAVIEAHRGLAAAIAKTAGVEGAGEIVIQPMLGPGIELIVGVRNDSRLGSFTAVGLGGVLAGLAGPTATRMSPVDEETARTMLEEISIAKVMAAIAAGEPYTVDALIHAVVALSSFGHALADVVATVEINPLVVLPQGRGVAGVDVLLEPQEAPTPKGGTP